MLKMVSSFVAVLGLAIVAGTPGQSQTASLTTLVSFNFTSGGAAPQAGLIADAKGNLFGTATYSGDTDNGIVFEIEKTASGYASIPTILVSFNGANGSLPYAGLIADANGNLFGTTNLGGANGFGTVFEIEKTATGYASTPTVLVSFNGTDGANPFAGVIADASGNLFGTTQIGGSNVLPNHSRGGTVFEIEKTASGYASTPTILYSFCAQGIRPEGCADGEWPVAGLLADANGNLFGTTDGGGANGLGTVFEIEKTASGYASTPTILVSFNGTDGANPFAGLIADASGNLFGTTSGGGANLLPSGAGAGTVFEIERTATGYAIAPTVLVSFNGTDGANPYAGLIADANGNLFGTTAFGGANDLGTVFKIEKTASGFASSPTVLANFNGANGSVPFQGGVIADPKGNLFGTTQYGGPNDAGTVFELQDTGFVTFPIFAGKRGTPNCVGVSMKALAQQYGGINNAAAARGYFSVSALQDAIRAFCRSSE
jgi:uncharacterized repeat protein (TIGR03803 family)